MHLTFTGKCQSLCRSAFVGMFEGCSAVELMQFVSRYYEGGVSSVYVWDLDDGFAGVVLLKKSASISQSVLDCC